MNKKLINIDPRAYNFMKQSAITSLEDAIIELITNADDAYNKKKQKTHRQFDIEIDTLNRTLIVRDHALGLFADGMKKCFLQVGAFTSDENSRGFFSRGAKDISALGDTIFESIKDNKYSKVTLDSNSMGSIDIQNKDVTQSVRDNLKIKTNGLQVIIHIDEKHVIDSYEFYKNTIPKIASLRNIFASKRNYITLLYDNKSTQLQYHFPNGLPILDITFNVPGFKKEATFMVYRSDKPFEKQETNRLNEYGFIISSEKVIHDVVTFEKEFKYNPDLRYFFGNLHSDYINQLLREYDLDTKKKNNPFPIIDPNRINGINKKHPFYKHLIKIPMQRVQLLLEEIEEDDTTDSIMSIDLGEFSNLLTGLNILDGKLLPNEDETSILVSNPKSKLIKAIESDRGKFIKVEKNYSLPLKKLKQKKFNLKSGIVTDHKIGFMFNRPEYDDEPQVNEKGEYELDDYSLFNMITDDNKDCINETELKKLYVYDKLSDKQSNPTFESQNIANAKPTAEFRLLFRSEPDFIYRYIIKRLSSGVTIKVNTEHPILKEHINTNDNKLENISGKGIILLHDMLTEAFTRLMLQKEAYKNKDMFKGDSVDTLESIFNTHDKKTTTVEKLVYDVMKKMLNNRQQKKLEEYQETIKKVRESETKKHLSLEKENNKLNDRIKELENKLTKIKELI